MRRRPAFLHPPGSGTIKTQILGAAEHPAGDHRARETAEVVIERDGAGKGGDGGISVENGIETS